jgi:hypothetical protein
MKVVHRNPRDALYSFKQSCNCYTLYQRKYIIFNQERKSMPNNSTSNKSIDLAQLFRVASQALAANQNVLNQADTGNGNHGDNMVQIFNLVTQALASQQKSSPAEQLAYASQALAQNATSGSSQVYAQGLAQAANQVKGKQGLTAENALSLVQALLGGQQSGSNASSGAGADLLGALLGGGSAGGASASDDGLDVGDLLNAGMAFMNAKQQGQDNVQALVSALVSSGPLGQQPHRQQSGEIVANALMSAIARMAKK